MKIFVFLAFIVLASGCAFGQAQLGPHPWTATVKVVDENGMPVEGASVSVSYFLTILQSANQDKDWAEIKGTTDASGTFTASHTDSSYDIGVDVQKTGYYHSQMTHNLLLPGQMDDKTVNDSRNPTLILVLKKIGKQIPMYAYRLDFVHKPKPALDKPVGFDLKAGDWVAPYGTGANSDMIFTWQKTIASNDVSAVYGIHRSHGWSETLTISFPNPNDGIQEFDTTEGGGSDLRSPKEAPESGYEPQLSRTQSWNPQGGGTNSYDQFQHNYLIRVETVLDESGTIKSALYGKIYGDFDDVFYTYLNPTHNSRNLEFDPKENLSKVRNKREPKVTAP